MKDEIDHVFIEIILLLGIIECIMSLSNLTSFIPSQRMAFKLAGTFDNPGLLSNYIAAIYPLALSNLLKTSDLKNKIIIYLSSLFILLGFITLVYLYARIAWIITIIGSIIVFNYRFHFIAKLLHCKIEYKIPIIFFVIVCIIMASIGMYRLNPESVNGRLLIYGITIQDSKNHLALGSGIDTFSRNYNLAQAEYFKNGQGTEQQLDNAVAVNTSLNEYLQILYETGIVGLIGVIIIILTILLNYKSFATRFENACFASLVSLLFAALFSYPFHNVSIIIFIIMLLSVLSRKLDFKIVRINKITLILFWGFLLAIGYFTVKEIYTLKQWQDAFSEKRKSDYLFLHKSLKTNKYFLYNYGLELINNNDLDMALKILNELTVYYIDDAVLTAIASIYLMQQDLDNAEKYYLLAHYVSPSKIYSLSRLVDIYYTRGQLEEAETLGKYVLLKKTKVHSAEAIQIKEKVESIINSACSLKDQIR